MVERRRAPEHDHRDAIRAALDDAGFVMPGSPSSEVRARRLVERIQDVFDADWRTEHRARAADRLKLRGQVLQIRRELEQERRVRRSLEAQLQRRQDEIADLRSRNRFLWFRLAPKLRTRPIETESAANSSRSNRRLEAEVSRLQDLVRLQRLLIKSAASLSVAAACSLTTWLEWTRILSGPSEYLVVGGTWILGLAAVALLFGGPRRATRIAGLALALLDLIANVLQILSSRGGTK